MMASLNEEVLEEVQAEYESVLEFPENIPKKQYSLCPVGLVGAGKSTIVKPLAQKLGLLRVSGDDIRFILHEKGLPYSDAWEIGRRVIEKYFQKGYSIAHDADCAAPVTIEALHKLSKETSTPLLWIHINPPESFIINKLTNYKHTWLYANAEQAIENYFKRKALHENLTMPFIFTFDTSKSKEEIDSQISEAVEVINDCLK